MLGAITGDVIGSVYEFHNTKDYGFPLFSERSNYTDDSIMSLAMARWLLDDPGHSYAKLEEVMVRFGWEYPCPMGGYGTGFRAWLFSPGALRDCPEETGGPLYESPTGRHPYVSYGNGSAMRVNAVGWFFDTLEETERVAEISAAITHDHPEGIRGAKGTAAAVYLARTGHSKEEIRDYIRENFGYDLSLSWDYWYDHYGWEASCQGTVPQALIAFLDSSDFEDAIRRAVSLGGDSDTLACITGGIAEAFYGGVPGEMAGEVLRRLPEPLLGVLTEFSRKTGYSFSPGDDKSGKNAKFVGKKD